MIDLAVLTPFQITTFVLGIVFSILMIAMVFYTMRHPRGYRNTFLKVLFTIILPMITFIMWFATVFAAYSILNSNELYILLLSIACGAALTGITVLIAWLMHRFVFKNSYNHLDEEVEEEFEEDAEEVEELEEDAEEVEELEEDAENAEEVEDAEEKIEVEKIETTEEAESTETVEAIEEVEAIEGTEKANEVETIEETETIEEQLPNTDTDEIK